MKPDRRGVARGQRRGAGHAAGGQRAAELDQACGSGRRAQVADEPVKPARHGTGVAGIPLREQPQFAAALLVTTGCGQLDGGDGRGRDRGSRAGLAHDPLECLVTRAGGTQPHAADHAPDRVACGSRVGQPLEHENRGPLAGDVAPRGAAVEHRHRPVRKEPAQRSAFEGHQVHAPLAGGAEHRVAGALPEHVHGRRQRRQARAVAGIEGQRAPHQVEGLGESAGERAARKAARLVHECRQFLQEPLLIGFDDPLDVGGRHTAAAEGRLEVGPRLGQPQPHLKLIGEVATEQRAHHDAGPHPVEAFRAPGVLDGRVGSLEQHELQRVGRGDLLGRHLVSSPVVDEVADEAANVAGGVPAPRAGTVERPGRIPAVGGHGADRRVTPVEEVEEGFERERTGQHAARPHDRDRLGVGILNAGRGPRRKTSRHMLRERHVDVEPADTEGVDRGAPRRAVGVGRPGERLGRHAERPLGPVELLVEFLRSRARRDHAVLHREHHLHEAGDPGGLEGVADVGLHAADRDLPSGRQVAAHQSRERAELRRVAHLGTGGVGLDVFDAGDVGLVGIGPLHGQHLPFLPRRPQALALAIAGHAEAADHRPDPVAVGDRPGELLDHEGHVALGRHQAVSVLAERAGARVAH